jgi:hypothetical protein
MDNARATAYPLDGPSSSSARYVLDSVGVNPNGVRSGIVVGNYYGRSFAQPCCGGNDRCGVGYV